MAVFWARSRSICCERELCQTSRIEISKTSVAPAMTTANAAASLKKIRFLTDSSFRNLKAVSRTTNRAQVTRILRIQFNFFPNAADVNVHRTRRHIGSIAPHRIEQLIAGEDATNVPGKIVQ